MLTPPTPDTIALSSLVFDCLLFGFSLLMFIMTMQTLLKDRSTYKLWIFFSVLLFAVSSTHLIIDVVRVNEGFITRRNIMDPNLYLSDAGQPLFNARVGVYQVQTFIGDAIIIYRAYVVWQSWKAIVIPSLLWVAEAVVNFYTLYLQINGPKTSIFAVQITRWIIACYVTTLACNLYATVLLAYRLWSVDQRSSSIGRVSKSPVRPALRIIVDSGLVYTLALIATLGCVIVNNPMFLFFSFVTAPLINICFFAIIIRLAAARNNKGNTTGQYSSFNAGTRSNTLGGSTAAYPLQSVEVHISRFNDAETKGGQSL